MIKLLIADDSALMRKLLESIFRDEGDFDIQLARDGNEALALVHSFDPHVVTLDVQMPGIDGLTCLGQIMIEKPRPVVMISALTADGAEATLTAIELGAIDFIAKPSGTVSLEIDALRPLLVAKVRAAAKARIRPTLRLTERVRHQLRDARLPSEPRRRSRPAKPAAAKASAAPSSGLLLIGTSTGGPAALDIVLPQLPAQFPWPVLVAQHLPSTFTGPFAKRLDQICELNVVEVDRPMPLQPGTIYIGRGDADLIVAPRPSGMIAMSVPAQRDYPWHPSVERMVASALEHFDARQLVGVLMTGMGDDGAHAMTQLRAQGGRTIAEAESTAVVWGMPGELVHKGGADAVLPVEAIAQAAIEWVNADAIH
uniref:Protein-glutamate methylesterase/protein-glutamine glutaminase n=1 Tax=Rhodopseudomonas palustris (strain BisA53) TaxID=316055 RepID=Q07KG9_RHOP5